MIRSQWLVQYRGCDSADPWTDCVVLRDYETEAEAQRVADEGNRNSVDREYRAAPQNQEAT